MEDEHAYHSFEMIRAVEYARTRGLDPANPDELARAKAEVEAMGIEEISDYTDGLRWDASVNKSHSLLTTATLIDAPELGIPECCAEPEPPWEPPTAEELQQEREADRQWAKYQAWRAAWASQPRQGRLRAALSRARTALTRPVRDRRSYERGADSGRDLSL